MRDTESPDGRSTSHSRTRVREEHRPFQHSGRGGYGNITEEATEEDIASRTQQQLYEAEVKKKYESGEAGHL